MLLAKIADGDDAELVRSFQRGDRGAYAAIVRRYQHRVYTLCFRWIGDAPVAEEVAQDVFLAVYRSLDRFRGEARLSTWIHQVTVNHCKNRRLYRMRRRVGRHEPLQGSGDDQPVRQIPADGPATDARIHRAEAEQLLNEGLEQLEEEQRQIVILRDIQHLAYDEIAEIMGLPRGTVKSRLHRARARLASVLAVRVSQEDVL